MAPTQPLNRRAPRAKLSSSVSRLRLTVSRRAAGRKVRVQASQAEHRDERVVACDAREVDQRNAGQLHVGQAGPAHQHQEYDGNGADPGAEQARTEDEGQQ